MRAVIGSVKFRKQIRVQHLRNVSFLIGPWRLKKSAEYQWQGEQEGETAAVSAFMGKLCKTITFPSSIKNLRDPALSYKEAYVSPLS